MILHHAVEWYDIPLNQVSNLMLYLYHILTFLCTNSERWGHLPGWAEDESEVQEYYLPLK